MHFSVGPLSNGGGHLRGGFHISANKVGWENISTLECKQLKEKFYFVSANYMFFLNYLVKLINKKD